MEPEPGGGNDGGIESSVAWHGHSDGDDPANGAQDLISKCLQMGTQTDILIKCLLNVYYKVIKTKD